MRSRGALTLAGVLVVLAVTFGHLLGPFDFLTFLRAGQAVLHGHSPYSSPSSPVFRSGHAFVYPLYVAWLFAPLAALPRQVAEAVYALASVTAIVASCRLLGRRGFDAAILLLVSSTTIIGLQMGTLNAFLLLGLAGAWHWRDSRPVWAGLLLGAAATAKLFLLPVLLWPLLRRRLRLAGAAAFGAVALMMVSAAAGSLSLLGYVRMMADLGAREQVASWSLSSFLQGLGLAGRMATIGSVLVAAACITALWGQRRRLDDGQLLGAAVVCSLLISPIVWSSYLLLLALPLLLVTRGNQALALFALASWAVVTPDAAPTSRVAVGVLLAVAVTLIVTWPTRRPVPARRELVTAAAAMAALVGGMLVLPAPARGPLPALAMMALSALWCLRPLRVDAPAT